MLRERIVKARETLVNVMIPDQLLEVVVRSCIALNIDGHRPDIVTVRAAKTLAAFEGLTEVTAEDVLRVSQMAIGFRTRRGGFEEPATAEEVEEAFTMAMSQKA